MRGWISQEAYVLRHGEGRELIWEQLLEETCALHSDEAYGSQCGASCEQRGDWKEQGMVTSELAVGLIPISFIAILLLVSASFITAYLQAQSVSYAVARNAAVGQPYDVSSLEVIGANRASIEVGSEGEYVVVIASVEPAGVLGWLDIRASSTILVPIEPGVALP